MTTAMPLDELEDEELEEEELDDEDEFEGGGVGDEPEPPQALKLRTNITKRLVLKTDILIPLLCVMFFIMILIWIDIACNVFHFQRFAAEGLGMPGKYPCKY